MSEPTTSLDRLASLLAHARNHDLGAHLMGVRVSRVLDVSLYEKVDESAIGALLPWAASIGARTVDVDRVDETYHLVVHGSTDDGTPLTVTIITREAEAARVAVRRLEVPSMLEGPLAPGPRAFPLDAVAACQQEAGEA